MVPFGISVDNVSASFSKGRCFNVSLSYTVKPTVSHKFFEITFDWDSDLYQMSGLSSTRTLAPLADGTYQASEDFEVCTPNLASSIVLFPLTIEALANHDRATPREWFKKFVNVPFVFGSETWQTDLNDELESLKARIVGGDQDPFTLRRYWRLLGTMYRGGDSEYAAYLRNRIQTEVPRATTATQSEAYYALLLNNGENLSVMFDPTTGRPAAIFFNESYQLKGNYHAGIRSLFQRGLVSKLLRVDSADSFELVLEKKVGSLIMLRYKRVREGVTLLPDKVIVFVEPSGANYTLRSIVVSLGDVGGVTCGRVNNRLLEELNPAHDPAITESWSGQFLYRHEGTYRCVYLWQSEKQLPVSGNMKVDHVRIVDMRTGEVLLDDDGIKPNGGNDDMHHFDTYLSVPYKTPSVSDPNTWYDTPTRLPALRAWAMGPQSAPVLYNDYYNPSNAGFTPSEVIDDLGPADDHTDYRYLQVFEHKPIGSGVLPTLHNFISWSEPGLYKDYLDFVVAQGYDLFLPDNTTGNPEDIGISYQFSFDEPNLYDNMLYLQAAAVTAQAYSMVQYSRYIWGLSNWGSSLNGSPWINGPSSHCTGDEEVQFTVQHRFDSPCPSWSYGCQGRDWIVMHSDVVGNKNTALTGIAHEYGHWVSNVKPKSEFGDNSSRAKNEALAFYAVSSLWANWIVDGYMRDDFASSAPDRIFAGNSAYASLLFDYHTGDMYSNARSFAGMYNQYMNMVGSYHTDPVIPWAYYESADYHWAGPVACKAEAHDYGGESLAQYAMDAAELYTLMLNKDYADRLVTENPPGSTFFGPNFVKLNTIEITRAAKQHDWLQLMGMEYASRVSASPSHAHAITASGNQATVLNVKYTPTMSAKWVNFFASANVKYNLYTIGGVGQDIELYRVLEDRRGGFLKLLGRNDECTAQTVVNSEIDNTAIIDVEMTHDVCPVIAGIAQPSVTFTPRKSGWFYALIKGTVVGNALVALEPASTQITATQRNATPAFDGSREWRLGQSIPVSVTETDAETRRGAFEEPSEFHQWKFQHYPPTRLVGHSDRGDSTRQFGPFLSSGEGPGQMNMSYVIRVVRPDDGTDLRLNLAFGRSNRSFVPSTVLDPYHVKTTVSGPLPGLVIDEWSMRTRFLNNAAVHQGGNVFLRLGRSVNGTIRPEWQYDIYVIIRNAYQPSWTLPTDTTSIQGGSDGTVHFSGIYSVPRWCNGENIEMTLDNFQITERLSPDDADYFQIWLEEGEHLNVTYRGKIPAAIDVDGPDKQSSMSESMLNTFMVRELVDDDYDRADHFSVGFGNPKWINDYRPVLTDQSQLDCAAATCACEDGDCANCCLGGNYFAQRGYLWNFNTCSASDDSLASVLDTLKCSHLPHELYSTSNITTDNALHLTLTAFISGRYTIRVRSQDDNGVTLDGYWLWDFPSSGMDTNRLGSPYTLDFNLGVYPNEPRPHWQWLEKRADPAPRLPCSRSGVCGDGVVHPREECDDGNTVGGDGCDVDCFWEN